MKKAGKALRTVLETYKISQNKLAIAMGIGRSTVSHWANETRDLAADAVLEIRKGLIDTPASKLINRLNDDF
ncbi:MAG: helix-turn-helix domain-containing protein [Xenococcaceae cyanobacterium]